MPSFLLNSNASAERLQQQLEDLAECASATCNVERLASICIVAHETYGIDTSHIDKLAAEFGLTY